MTFECHFYSGSHGFMRKSDAAIYHPESADLAWNRTLAFLKQRSVVVLSDGKRRVRAKATDSATG